MIYAWCSSRPPLFVAYGKSHAQYTHIISQTLVYMKLYANTLEPIWVNEMNVTEEFGDIYMVAMEVDASGNLILAGTTSSRE